jgi:GTP cyclohydrolase I
MNASTALPDIALQQHSIITQAIDWVGMQGIALPAIVEGEHAALQLDISVNLPNPTAKGIHMSRLYLLAQTYLADQEITRDSLITLLYAVIDSHRDLGSTAAALTFHTRLLRKRPALISDLNGWKFYPLTVKANLNSDTHRADLRAHVSVDYSSTCPCSAALARQLLQEAFLAEWQFEQPTPRAIGDWLAQHGSVATPHSQRSEARVSVSLTDNTLPITELINSIESALGTPVQTAVKRADEQAFARLNGENLMYAEDAVRRVQAALAQRFCAVNVDVIHRESLHQHDAVASIHHSPTAAF